MLELPNNPIDFLSNIIDAYPKSDSVTLHKVMGLGKVIYQDDLVKGTPMTAAVVNTTPYTLIFGKKFIKENLKTIEDAVYLLSHELTHLILDHFAKDILDEFNDKELGFNAAHIIVDCQVNATVYNSLQEEKYLEFIKRYYHKENMPYCFFRPDGIPKYSKKGLKQSITLDSNGNITYEPDYVEMPEKDKEFLLNLHKKLYSEDGITNKELIDGLYTWFESQDNSDLSEIVKDLLGNHDDLFKDRGSSEEDENLNDLTNQVGNNYLNRNKDKNEDKNKEEIEKDPENKNGGKKGGSPRGELIKKCIDNLEYIKSIKNKLKKQEVITPSAKIYKAIYNYLPKTCTRTVIPNFYDQRTISTYSKTKKVPIFSKNRTIGSKVIVPCYLDVSGSQAHVIPHTTQAVILLKREIGNVVYCFSTKISASSIKKLKEGEYETTGGTDFNPVIEHIIENKFKNAVILTDGEAGLSDNNIKRLKRLGTKITIIWTVKSPTKNPLSSIADNEVYLFND